MAKRTQGLRLASAPSALPEDQMVAVMLPAGWMRAIDDKLERILRGTAPLPPRPAPPAEEYVDRKQAAEITGYSPRTIYRLIHDGILVATGLRGNRIKRSDLDKMMAAVAKERGSAPVNEAEEISAEVDKLLNDE